MFKNVTDIFETFGLGRMEVVNNDNKKKTCIIRVYDCPLVKEIGKSQILTAAMSGMFSFLFNKDVDAKQLASKQEFDYYEFVIK